MKRKGWKPLSRIHPSVPSMLPGGASGHWTRNPLFPPYEEKIDGIVDRLDKCQKTQFNYIQ